MEICENCDGTGECPMCNGLGLDEDNDEECGCCFGECTCPECDGTGEQ